jgi:hypothetical protein
VAVTKTVTAEVALWGGPGDPQIDQNRPLRAQRACECGCDERGGKTVIGYVTGSKNGHGLTIFAPDEDTYATMVAVFGGQA